MSPILGLRIGKNDRDSKIAIPNCVLYKFMHWYLLTYSRAYDIRLFLSVCNTMYSG